MVKTSQQKVEYNRRRKEKLLAVGMCGKCGRKPHVSDGVQCEDCREQNRANSARRRIEKADKVRDYARVYAKQRSKKLKNKGLCIACGNTEPLPEQQRCQQCKEKMNEAVNRNQLKLKEEAFVAYGGYRCQCCGLVKDPEFMQLDHVNGGGTSHRRAINGHVYRWLKKNDYPPGFQVLCADCNFSKGRHGCCHHKSEAYREKMRQELVGWEGLLN